MSLNLTSTRETDILRVHKHVPTTEKIQHDNSSTKDLVISRRDLVVDGRVTSGASCKPPHRRRPSSTELDIEEISASVESVLKSGSANVTTTNIKRRLFADDVAKDSSKVKTPTSTCDAEDFDKYPSLRTLPKENGDLSVDSNKGLKSVKYVKGVAVVSGRTHRLVDKFEKRDKSETDECQKPDLTARILPNTDNVSATAVEQSINVVSCAIAEARTPILSETPHLAPCPVSEARSSLTTLDRHDVVSSAIPEAATSPMPVRVSDIVPCAQPVTKTSQIPLKTPDMVSSAVIEAKTSQMLVKRRDSYAEINSEEANSSPVLVVRTPKTSPNMVREKVKVSPVQRSVASRRVVPEKVRSSPMLVTRRCRASSNMIPERTKASPQSVVPRHDTSPHMTTDKAKFSPLLEDNPQTTGRCMSKNDDDDADVVEDLLLDHELFTSTLRYRLTKLQVIRNFCQRNDLRGAINALQKLPDHAVQADVISVMLENIESLTLDLFSCLLPLLLGLLDSETERHINVSLEMLLKLVAVFGPVITSTISAPPAVGVNLQAEKRLECCSQCHVQLQKIQKGLLNVIRRGGLTARTAQELILILEQS